MESQPMPSKKKPLRILCIGMPVRDLIFRVDDVPTRGTKKRATHFTELTGGNALNAAVAISRLGGRVRMSGPMGHAGEKTTAHMFDDMEREGIENALVHMPGLVTPISSIMIDPSGERTIVTYRDPELWKVTLPHADLLLKDCDAVLTENRCAAFVTDLCVEARNRAIPVILDADRVMSLSEGVLVASSHIIFSAEALHATAGMTDDTEALRKIADLTPGFLAVTNGAQGVLWLDDERRPHHMPSFPVHTVDTLGAGDVFHGAFALGVAEGQPIRDAMRFASAAAALKCTRHGGAFASPQRAEVERLLAESPVLKQAGE
ncbi:sugar kinase [Bradyrhizobium sp. SYSU BS000235]|uniref:sugar kinase n=1 Tax=Bradyrhizobium sp. SYSU BS000235 TaxID=3411332 RepID=UPI003C73850A